MADNVVAAQAPVVVATKQGPDGAQYQRVVPETVVAGIPIDVASTNALPVVDERRELLLTAILVELRVSNELLMLLVNPPSETLDTLRAAAALLPIA